jgi:SAM-dependent methyltransferase
MIDYKLDMTQAITISVLCRAFSAVNERDGAKKTDKPDEHAYIPSSVWFTQVFLKILSENNIGKEERVLDLGCGISSILSYLYFDGFTNLVGVDNDPLMVDGMSTMCRTEEGDLLDMDGELRNEISEAKVIYMYAPISEILLYKKVIEDVAEHMSEGSILVSLYGPKDICRDVKDVTLCRVDMGLQGMDSWYPYLIKEKTK